MNGVPRLKIKLAHTGLNSPTGLIMTTLISLADLSVYPFTVVLNNINACTVKPTI